LTPAHAAISVTQSVLFLLMFRYVMGGAIGVQDVSYVDFLVPGFVVSGLIFTAGGSAVAVAEDAASGLHDHLRSTQAAQGLGILGVPFSFLSSAFVPVDSMPPVLEAFADHQPLTFMVDAVRGLLLGEAATATFEHGLSYYVVGSLLWSLALMLVFAPLALRAYRRG
jgi:ABC-type multidrug transport system permease subunit